MRPDRSQDNKGDSQQRIESYYRYVAEEIKANQDRRAFLIVKKADGWHVADKAGPFKTREAARTAREGLKNNQQEMAEKTT